jgi:hypothetical protein
VSKRSGLYPRFRADARWSGVVSQAGGLLLTDAIRSSGLDAALSKALARWRKPLARHDAAKIVLDLAVALALGGFVWPISRCCAVHRMCSVWLRPKPPDSSVVCHAPRYGVTWRSSPQ